MGLVHHTVDHQERGATDGKGTSQYQAEYQEHVGVEAAFHPARGKPFRGISGLVRTVVHEPIMRYVTQRNEPIANPSPWYRFLRAKNRIVDHSIEACQIGKRKVNLAAGSSICLMFLLFFQRNYIGLILA
jgi:hypothetical protein